MKLIDENEAINALRTEFKRSPTIAIRAMEVIRNLTPVTSQSDSCEGCKHLGYEYLCLRCKRRVEDHYER